MLTDAFYKSAHFIVIEHLVRMFHKGRILFAGIMTGALFVFCIFVSFRFFDKREERLSDAPGEIVLTFLLIIHRLPVDHWHILKRRPHLGNIGLDILADSQLPADEAQLLCQRGDLWILFSAPALFFSERIAPCFQLAVFFGALCGMRVKLILVFDPVLFEKIVLPDVPFEFPDLFAVNPVNDLFAFADPPQHVHPRKNERAETHAFIVRHRRLFRSMYDKGFRLTLEAVPENFLDIVFGHAPAILFETQRPFAAWREERRILASVVNFIAELPHEPIEVPDIGRKVYTLPHIEREHILHGELPFLVSTPLGKAQAMAAGILDNVKSVLAAELVGYFP